MNTRLLLAATLVLATPFAYAQDATPAASASSVQNTPASPSPSHHRDGGDHNWGQHREWNRDDAHGRGMERDHGAERGWGHNGRGGERMLAFGMWWKNPAVAARVGLTAEQQKHIGDLFLQSRVQLIHLHATLQEEQLMLEPLLNSTPFDEAKALEQIDKIADTRADLEKSNAKMLLSIRGVLTADQWTKLRSGGHGMRGQHGDWGGRGPKGPSTQN
jgi:Spy/CpxP family protein refolding chaperone